MSVESATDTVAREQTQAIACALADLQIQVLAMRRELDLMRAELNRRPDHVVQLRSY
jgi:hypothetical protein